MMFPPCLIEHNPLSSIKMTSSKKTLEQIVKGEWISLLVKPLRKLLTITACISHSYKQTQATNIQKGDIRMSISLPYV